ncbi:unnamed protein product [Musa acuminata subsp. malaccensis]|uniref:(wild Malaysian banana) hypothetical protein n=1 Tax=Musa acuminata subsp. malaccensis TaxID=214687 RepID=A0A804IM96_MUSAM|nr:unnamed protein product [Musa acuminata subsp. malaccensis]
MLHFYCSTRLNHMGKPGIKQELASGSKSVLRSSFASCSLGARACQWQWLKEPRLLDSTLLP